MTVFVLDTFTAPDGTLLTGRTPDIAPAGATWFPVGPPPLPVGDILSNQARIQDIGDGSGRGYLVESDVSDAEITMRFTGNSINPTFGGLKFRGTLVDHWVVRQDASTNTAILFRPNGSIADSATLITGVNEIVDFVLSLRGTSISCLITNFNSGAVVTLSTTDITNETATLHGLHSRTAFGAGVGDFFDNFQVETLPPPVGSGDVRAEVTSFDTPAATGFLRITSPELGSIVPKAVAFYWSWTQPGNVEDLVAAFGNGAATGPSNQWAWAILQDDIQPQAGSRTIFTDKCIVMPDQAGGLSTDFEAEFVQFIPGGVQIKITKAATPAFQVAAIFFAGTDVEAIADNHPTTPDPLDLTNIGFEPDFVIAATGAPVAAGTVVADVRGGYGWQDFDINPNEVGLYVRNETPSGLDPLSLRPTGQIAGNLSAFGIPTTSFRYDTPDAQGMTANFDVGTASDLIGFLAVRATGVGVAAGAIDSPIVTGDWVVSDPGFTPQFVLLLLCMRRNFDQAPDGEPRRYGVGIFTPDAERSPTLFLNAGGVSADHTSHFVQKAVTLASEPSGVIEFEGDFKSMDTFGWTLDMSVADPQIKRWGWLAIGEAVVPAAPVEDIICEPDPWTS